MPIGRISHQWLHLHITILSRILGILGGRKLGGRMRETNHAKLLMPLVFVGITRLLMVHASCLTRGGISYPNSVVGSRGLSPLL